MHYLMIATLLMLSPFKYEWPEIGDESFNLRTSEPVVKKAEDAKFRHILYFTATWCGPCNNIQKPELERMEKSTKPWQIGSKIKRKDDHIWVYDYDADSELASKYNITLVPTFILVDGNGQEIVRTTGCQTSHQLAELYSRKKP